MMSQARTENPQAVPTAIRRTLRKIIRRARTVILLKGLCATIAVAVLALLVVMGIDAALTILSPWPRRMLTGGAWVLTALTAISFVVRPLAKSFTLTGIARAIESRHPELHERISSAIQLLASDDAPEMRGSDALIGALATEATLDAKGVAPRREITLRPMRPFLIAAAAVLAALGGLLAAWPKQTSLLLARAVTPAANLPHVSAAALVMKPGCDVAIAAGEKLEVTLSVRDRTVTSAEIRVDHQNDQPEEVLKMAHVGADAEGWPRFSCTLGPAARSFSYRARAASGGPTRYYRVSVVERPAVTRLDLHFEYPPYTEREERSEVDTGGDINAIAGTVVTINAMTNVPLTAAELRINDRGQHVEPAPPLPAEPGKGSCTFRLSVAEKLTGKWTLKLTRTVEGRAFESLPIVHSIQAVPDSPPAASILAPDTTQLKLQPADVVTVRYELSDDFALGSAEMLISTDGNKLHPLPLTIAPPDGEAGQTARQVTGTAALDLGAMDLRNVKFVTFQLRATDNLPATSGGPQEGLSSVCNIELQTDAPSYAVQVMLAQELIIRQRLQQVLAHVQAAHKQTAPLCESAKVAMEARQKKLAQAVKDGRDVALIDVEPLTRPQLKHIEAIRGELGSADDLLVDLIQEIAGGVYSPTVELIRDLSGRHVGKAYHLAGQIRLIETLKGRHDLADETDNHVARTIEILNEMLERLGVQGNLARKALQMQEMARLQAELAAALKSLAVDRPAATQEANPAQQDRYASIDLWQEAQASLAGQVAAEAEKTPAALAMLTRRDSERGKNLAQRARQLAARQTVLAQRTRDLKDLDATRAQLAAPGTAQGTPAQKPTTQELANKRDQQAQLLSQALLRHLLDQQDQLSRQVAQASDTVKDIWPQMDRLDTYAARAARDTTELLGSGRLLVASRRAAQGAQKLADLAKRFGAPVSEAAWATSPDGPEDKEPNSGQAGGDIAVEGSTKQQPDQIAQLDSPDMSQQREELARQVASLGSQQKFLASKMEALQAGQTGQVLCLDQGDLAVRTGELAADVELLGQHAEHLMAYEPIRKSAADAAAQIAKAQEAQHKAKQLLAEANPGGAIAGQEAATKALTAAAEALEALGKTLLQAAAKAKPPEEQDTDDGHLADAFESAERAARENRMSQAQRAADLLSQLAQAAMAKADQEGLAMQMSPDAALMTDSTGGMVFLTDQEVRKLETMGVAMEDWARLPGELRDEVLQAVSDASPEQYRALIKRYFQAVARQGSSPGATDGPGKTGGKK